MTAKLVTGPAKEVLTTAEAKGHLRVDVSDDDAYIDGLVSATRIYFEDVVNRALITQTWRLNLEAWPDDDEILIPRAPLQSVTSVVYKDQDGNATTWASSNYIVDSDSEPGRVVLAYGGMWPSVTLYPVNPIMITFVAGYGDDASDVPAQMKQCLKLLIGHWYENREPVVIGHQPNNIPFTIESLIWLNRVFI